VITEPLYLPQVGEGGPLAVDEDVEIAIIIRKTKDSSENYH
jgi:hypothetical protein